MPSCSGFSEPEMVRTHYWDRSFTKRVSKMMPTNSGRYPAIQDAYKAVVSQIARRLKRLGMEPLQGLEEGLDTTDQFAVALLSDQAFLLGKPIAIVKLEGADQGCAFKFTLKLVAVSQILVQAEGEDQAKLAIAFVDLTPAGPGFSHAYPFPGIEPANSNWYQKMQNDFTNWYVVSIVRTTKSLASLENSQNEKVAPN